MRILERVDCDVDEEWKGHAWLALPLLLVSEILERQLLFQAVQAPKMPDGFGSAREAAFPAELRA